MEVTYTQILPYKVLALVSYPTEEKAIYWAEKWIDAQKDSYNERLQTHLGPDYFYTIWR